MTINIHHDTLLQVLERQPSLHHPLDAVIEGGVPVFELRKSIRPDDFHVEKIRAPTCDDEYSVDTYSTASLSDDSDCESSAEIERRVAFAEGLVTDVWTRPFTLKEDIPSLFYSTEETQRFRQEYRLERKLLTELSIDPDNRKLDREDLSIGSEPPSRHRISRVVVVHNDKLETFFDKPHQEPQDVFFDNDSFWSGSITWY